MFLAFRKVSGKISEATELCEDGFEIITLIDDMMYLIRKNTRMKIKVVHLDTAFWISN